MSKIGRSEFIRRNLLGGLLATTAIPFLSSFESKVESDIKFSKLKIPADYESINWSKIRKQFLLSPEKYYFNMAGLGASPKTVIDKIHESMLALEVKASHGRHSIDATHEQLAKFLSAEPKELAITRNATEGMNIIARSLHLEEGDEILLTKHEHVGGAAPWMALQKEMGISIKLLDLDLEGKDNLEIIRKNISKKTKVVSFSHVTCTTGMILPAKEIAALCREKGIHSCVDGAQAIGMIPIDLKEMNPDFYACSGHKWLLGPKGTGVLFINKNVIGKCVPPFVGAYTDTKYDLNSLTMEYRLSAQREEYGTRNTPITLGLGEAVDFISTIGIDNIAKRGRELGLRFRDGVCSIPQIELLTPKDAKYAGAIQTFRLKGKDNLALTNKLNKETKLRLRGIYENDLDGIRASFGIFNSEKEVDYLISTIKKFGSISSNK